jgi:hypothetical protein
MFNKLLKLNKDSNPKYEMKNLCGLCVLSGKMCVKIGSLIQMYNTVVRPPAVLRCKTRRGGLDLIRLYKTFVRQKPPVVFFENKTRGVCASLRRVKKSTNF